MQVAHRAYETEWPVDPAPAPTRRGLRLGFLPELEPARAAHPVLDMLGRMGVRFDQGSIQEEPTDFRDRPERRDPIARLTVYALNAAVMVFFFPLGFALLIFNILGGENLRTTAHALALTGLGMALAAAGFAAALPTGF